jgi:hypothetical protein
MDKIEKLTIEKIDELRFSVSSSPSAPLFSYSWYLENDNARPILLSSDASNIVD